MTLTLARQSIFNLAGFIHAYELLARPGPISAYRESFAARSFFGEIHRDLLIFELQSICDGKKAFVNFSRESLLQNWVIMLSPDLAVIEILETVRPDAEVLEACRELKRADFSLALDDFEDSPEMEPLVELADIIKIDFRASPAEVRIEVLERYASYEIQFLAEKVETLDDYKRALDEGFSLFQGYFFSEPEIIYSTGL